MDENLTLEDLIAERERLMAEKQENGEVIASCRGQIEAAQARVISSGEYADPAWFARVKSRARHAGRLDQQIQIRLSEIRTQIKGMRVEENVRDEGDGSIKLLIEAIQLIQRALNIIRKED